MEIEELRKIAAKTEVSLNYIAKDLSLSEILKYLEGEDKIILKGGTAVNRVYIDNKRFSEDIDLDIISKCSIKRTISATDRITKNIQDFKIAKPRIMNETIRYDCYFENPLGHKDKIRLEFKPVKSAKNYSKKIVNFGFVPTKPTLMNVYDLNEIIKQKIECIKNRIEGKDFFDLYYLIDITPNLKLTKTEKKQTIEKIDIAIKESKQISNTINPYTPKSKRPQMDMFLEELKNKIL